MSEPVFCAVCFCEVKPEDSAEDSGHVFHAECLRRLVESWNDDPDKLAGRKPWRMAERCR